MMTPKEQIEIESSPAGQIARRLEQSASGMMRASKNALESGDVTGAAREQTIAAREYQWAAQLWMALGHHTAKMACFARADSVMRNEWVDSEIGQLHRESGPHACKHGRLLNVCELCSAELWAQYDARTRETACTCTPTAHGHRTDCPRYRA